MNELPKSVRDELARQQAASVHPDADLLNAYSEGTATPGERTQIEQHLAICGDCREVLFLAVPEKPAEAPAVVTTKPHRRWFPAWAPWAAAAAVLIAATFTYTRHQSPTFEAKLSKNPPPASAPAAATTEKEDKQKFQAKLDSPAQEQPSTKTVPIPSVSAPADRVSSTDSLNESYRRDELKKKSEDASAFSRSNKDNSLAGTPVIGGQPAVAVPPPPSPAPEQPSYAARAKNSALKPGPAAPSQNQMQYQVQNQAAQNVSVGAATETVEVTAANGTVPVQDSKVAGALSAEITNRKTRAITNFRIAPSGVVERELSPGNWQTSLAKPGTEFTVVAVIGPDIWAGGTHGALQHSVDGGRNWRPIILPGIEGQPVTAIEFRDVWNGKVTTADHHSWTTTDRGNHWQQP